MANRTGALPEGRLDGNPFLLGNWTGGSMGAYLRTTRSTSATTGCATSS
ncbi:MAG: hypothetical protein U0736_19065 [Gemmataceae bacterium]